MTNEANPVPRPQQGFGAQPEPAQPVVHAERVARGLGAALIAVVVAVVLTVVLWRMGFLASITSFVMAAGAAYLYTRGAGSAPRRGLAALISLIVLGVVLSLFALFAGLGLFSTMRRLIAAAA